jgi:uncharacterized membrane protein
LDSTHVSPLQSNPAPLVDKLVILASKYWLLVFAVVFGIYVWLPFLAPVFMATGLTGLGKGIYFIYSFLCHQLPERSYFFFGEKISYSLPEIRAAWQNTNNPMVLRQFTGSPSMGWKAAWSDRMISLYTSIWLFGLAWLPLRQHIKPLPLWGLALFLLPMGIDGASHFISDLAGLGQGFRDSNAWLVAITHGWFAPSFYAGDALGSFNSWMRILTGVLFGLGIVWFGFPYIDDAFLYSAQRRQAHREV